MYPYPMLYANFQKTSFQEQLPLSKYEQLWFTETTDDPSNPQFPRAILVSDKSLIVEYSATTACLDLNGSVVWKGGYGGFPSCSFMRNSTLYLSGTGGATLINPADGSRLLSFPIFTAREFVYLIYPVDKDRMLAHTFTPPPFEQKPGKPPREDLSTIILMRSPKLLETLDGDPDDWEYMHEISEKTLPALMTNDEKHIAVITINGTVYVYSIESGKRVGKEKHPGMWPLGASLDKNDNLVVLFHSPEGHRKAACFPLQGEEPIWESQLPGSGEISLPQPPAIGADGRVYCMADNTLCAVDKNLVSWEYTAFPARYFRYITVLADNSVLVAAANKLSLVDKDGAEIFFTLLPPGEDIATPPVIDAQGRIYFGTIKGIYCFG